MATSYGTTAIIVVIATIGLVTFAIRVSFISLFGRIDKIPPRFKRALRFVPAAVLAALVAPSLIVLQPETGIAIDKLISGMVATAVAWRTENILGTLTAGMGTIWILGLVL